MSANRNDAAHRHRARRHPAADAGRAGSRASAQAHGREGSAAHRRRDGAAHQRVARGSRAACWPTSPPPSRPRPRVGVGVGRVPAQGAGRMRSAQDKAASIIDRINIGRSSKGLEALKWMDARAVAELIRHEHPQIIAIVLAYLDPDQAAEILALPAGELRADVVDAHRHARRRAAQRAVRARRHHGEAVRRQARPARPRRSAARRPRRTSSTSSSRAPKARSWSRSRTPTRRWAAKIQDLIFVFDNLIEIDDRSMQELLRQVPSDRCCSP